MLKIIALIFVLIASSKLIIYFKKYKSLSQWGFIFWLLLWMITLVFIFNPNLSINIAKFLGMGRGIDSLFLLSIILNFYLIFILYLKIDRLDKNTTDLAVNVSKKFHNIK
jgi:hypothetical protein